MALKSSAWICDADVPGLEECWARDSDCRCYPLLGGVIVRCYAYALVHRSLCQNVDVPRKRWLFSWLMRWQVDENAKTRRFLEEARYWYPLNEDAIRRDLDLWRQRDERARHA